MGTRGLYCKSICFYQVLEFTPTSGQERKYCMLWKKYLILLLEGNAAKFPLALHVQLSGTILESHVNQMASKYLISLLKLKTKKDVTNIDSNVGKFIDQKKDRHIYIDHVYTLD